MITLLREFPEFSPPTSLLPALRPKHPFPCAMSLKQQMKHWWDPAAIPIFVTVGVAVGGSAWYLLRLARGPDVVWDRHGNSQPWNNVRQDQNLKMWSINQDFSSKFKRSFNIGKSKDEQEH